MVKKCEEQIDEKLEQRVNEVRHVMKCQDRVTDIYGDKYEDVHEWINSWALAYTDDPHYRAKRLELSYGGPSDGFRFFEDDTISYYYHDWFDGAHRNLHGDEYDTMKQFHDTYLSF